MTKWTQEQIEGHLRAAKVLDQIMADSFDLIKNNKADIDEYEVQQFIVEQYGKNDLISDTEPPIVSFGKNTQNMHYFPSKYNCSKLQKDDLIMIDIWARENKEGMPFADITWMGFNGAKVPSEQQRIFDLVISARDTAVIFIKKLLRENKLPILGDIDQRVTDIFEKKSVAENFLHTTGHVLGFEEDHGDIAGVISWKNKNKLTKNIGYTIEPGLYFDKKFGVRSEIDFYVNDQSEINITSSVQDAIVLLN